MYEPRLLFQHAARHSFETRRCPVALIHSGGLVEEVFAFDTDDGLFAAGLSGAGEELFSLLRMIHRLAAQKADLVVWLPEGSVLLAQLMHGLGVQTLLCESYLQEELPQRMANPNFSSPHLPQWRSPIGKGETKRRLSESELDTLIDCARGLDSRQIATLRHSSYKTVFTHKRNARIRLQLENATQWLDLLARLEQLHTL